MVANVTARVVEKAGHIRELLVQQLVSPVRWSESVEQMVGMGTELFLEIGPGKVLRGLIRRIAPQVESLSVGDWGALEALSTRYGEDTSEPQSMEGSA